MQKLRAEKKKNSKLIFQNEVEAMKLNMQKYKAEDHAQRYYDVQDLGAVKCVKDDIVGFMIRWGHCLPSYDTGGTGSVWGSRTSAHVLRSDRELPEA